MKKVLLILGNISFNHFSEKELKKFKDSDAPKALVHEITGIIMCNDEKEAVMLGEDLVNEHNSYLIPDSFAGEIAYQLPILKDFVKTFVKLN